MRERMALAVQFRISDFGFWILDRLSSDFQFPQSPPTPRRDSRNWRSPLLDAHTDRGVTPRGIALGAVRTYLNCIRCTGSQPADSSGCPGVWNRHGRPRGGRGATGTDYSATNIVAFRPPADGFHPYQELARNTDRKRTR